MQFGENFVTVLNARSVHLKVQEEQTAWASWNQIQTILMFLAPLLCLQNAVKFPYVQALLVGTEKSDGTQVWIVPEMFADILL